MKGVEWVGVQHEALILIVGFFRVAHVFDAIFYACSCFNFVMHVLNAVIFCLV